MPAGRGAPIRLALVAALALGAAPAAAPAGGGELTAGYWANSGSLPPEWAWSFEAAIAPDGRVTGRWCRGYETSGPDCRHAEGRADAAALAALAAAVAASGILADPPAGDPYPPVGGPGERARVTLDGRTADLPAHPAGADRARVAAVLAAIRAALPAEVLALADGG